ncbi:unnamed protein product [Nesidiocoris tenuis]|uniref:Protein kinase domain-containing protein n=1 Tax=Nesidiocoris tenuis TaxID=355587 RepID=A0A6H5HBY8_9HEMI|nr:unnamed protein product [Nesidiocoris tenuis]
MDPVVAELKQEIERLSRELDQASSEKVQSAKFGLLLLEEKKAVLQKCEELEGLYENAKNELDITQEALAKFQTTHKVTKESGIEQEESLLSESAAMETSLTTTIIDLENELKQVRQEYERVVEEKERILNEFAEQQKVKSEAEKERKQLRSEVRELKLRETRLLTDYSELEEENITLQKQVSGLKSSQVEFEGAKHEITRLREELELYQQQVDELTKLKRIAEKQMEEALESLQAEREAKYAMKKELDHRINSESMFNLSNLAFSIRGMGEEGALASDDDDLTLKRFEADLQNPEIVSPETKQVDLFSEIHLNELKKLEKQLEQVENEKVGLAQTLREAQTSAERFQSDLQVHKGRIIKLMSNMDSLHYLAHNFNPSSDDGTISQLKNWHKQAVDMIDLCHQDIEQIDSNLNGSDVTAQLRVELTSYKNKLIANEQKVLELQEEINQQIALTTAANNCLEQAHNDLTNVSDELAQLYHHVCTVNGEIPTRVLLDHEKHVNTGSGVLVEKNEKNSDALPDAAAVTRNVETILDQVKHLKIAVIHTIERAKAGAGNSDLFMSSLGPEEVSELQEQVIKLKSLLSTKREQIATLRSVLKSNKNTAEFALSNLKSKYDNEKAVVSETMMKLRNELRNLKEEQATFSSLRAVFAARCEDYVTQVDELQRLLNAAEEEKKTLNQLLRLAVQQKLMLNQKIEDYEVDREMRNARRPTANHTTRGGMKPRFNSERTMGVRASRLFHLRVIPACILGLLPTNFQNSIFQKLRELEAKFPYRDVQLKRGVDVNEYYNLEAEIGRGKFGTVYLCREKKTGLALAAKFVGIQRRQDRKNVEREVEIMRTLQHPRLIQLYDAFETDNTMVVVLELLSGLSPFMGDTDVETMSNVTLGRYDFDDESFDNISNSAKDFIANLLVNKKEARMTADECLNHEWLRKKIPPPPPELVTTKENLKTFLDNYNNTNVIAENGINNMMIPKSSLSAVELIEASDKQFLNRDDAKCFSKLGNDQILHPVSLPDVLTNANPIVNDNEPPLVPPIVKNVPNANDEVLNVVNANFYSMPNPPVLDNSSSVIDNSQFVSDLVAKNVNLVQDPSLNELRNNNVSVASSSSASIAVKTEPMPPTVVTPALQKSPSNVIPVPLSVPEVPVAPLPFISKSLPAAAVLLDETLRGNWPLIPLPTTSLVDDSDEPIIVHPPVVGTTLPRKRGSMDVGSLTPKRGSIDVENILQKRGSFEITSFLPKRDSVDLVHSPLNRLSSDISKPGSRRESMAGDDKMASPILPAAVSPTPVTLFQPQIAPAPVLPGADRDAFARTEPVISQLSTDGVNILQPSGDNEKLTLFPERLADADAQLGLSLPSVKTVPNDLAVVGTPPPPVSKLEPSHPALLDAVEEIFIPQPPVIARAVPIPSVQSLPRPEPDLITPSKILESIEPKILQSVPTTPLGTQPSSPLVFSPELSRTPTSPLSPSFFSPSRRESPLQKTLDEIPKLSSEILSSLSNITSLSSSSTYESISRKPPEVRSNTNSSDSNKVGTSRYERVSSPRLMSFTEHKPSSLIGTAPSKTFSTSGSNYSRTKTEGSSAFASVTSKTYSTSSFTSNRSESKETESSRQTSRSETLTRTDSKTSSIELDSQGFKPKLRSTAPWFSQKKTESEKTIEQKSTDISALLKENLGPLERSRWAREVRQISAKLVELSKDQTNRKQQEEDHLVEMNKQQNARRQKFKLSILNRDVVLGEAREFYVSGEVPMGAHGISHLKQNSSTTSSTSSRSHRTSPERSAKPLTRNVAK